MCAVYMYTAVRVSKPATFGCLKIRVISCCTGYSFVQDETHRVCWAVCACKRKSCYCLFQKYASSEARFHACRMCVHLSRPRFVED